jgi:hypothetical protein
MPKPAPGNLTPSFRRAGLLHERRDAVVAELVDALA